MQRLLILSLVAATTVAAAAPSYAADYVAHEWGTFTSLQDSSGKSAEGMFHEDELLPDFVHGRGSSLASRSVQALSRLDFPDPGSSPYPCHRKDCDFDVIAGTPLTVTQKMETPVIYFYSQEPRQVRVDVDFPGGIITQYYPNVTDFSPPLGKVDAVANGHVRWDVQVSTEKLPLPEVPGSSIWAPSRQVRANDVTVAGENERLLFYRGLGHFDTSIKITDDEELAIHNASDQAIPAAFLLEVTPQGAAVRALGSVAAHGKLGLADSVVAGLALEPVASYLPRASALVASALERSGLYHDEALAMVNTWQKSYFTTPGLRVLYVLPRQWTDSLLPLTLTPAPKELVRTLVGRVEVMTRAEEQGLLSGLRQDFATAKPGSADARIAALGRFAEAKLRRVLELASLGGEDVAFVRFLNDRVQIASR